MTEPARYLALLLQRKQLCKDLVVAHFIISKIINLVYTSKGFLIVLSVVFVSALKI